MDATLVFQIIILIISVIIHEVSHGWMALLLGDPTAELAGRLTLNPLPHLDLFGSIILPLLLVLSHVGMVVGWAKPVPYNINNLRDARWGPFLVALAGPLSNIIIALVFGTILRWGVVAATSAAGSIMIIIVVINLVLALFNLIPIPPLDGSKIFFSLFGGARGVIVAESWAYRYQFLLIFLALFLAGTYLAYTVPIFFHLLTGFSL